MSVYESEATPRLGRDMWKRFAIGGILVVLLTTTAVATGLLLQVHESVQIFQRESTPIPGIRNELDKVDPGGPQTILVLGSDRRYGDGKGIPARSDTIIVVRLDPEKNATAILSIPRDLRVEIPGHGMDKINVAYAEGGPKLTVQTVKELLAVPISHVVNVNFGGFQRAVNRLGCVYVDIDRRYFNANGGPGGYATIDLKPGYQKLCGKDALDFVRYRHTDDDFVRAARQQEFLRQAKDQIGLGKVFGDRDELLRIFGRYTQTDIARDNDAAILRLIKLAYESSKHPIREIKFRGGQSADGEYVEVSIENLQKTIDEFIDVGLGVSVNSASTEPKKRKRPKRIKSSKRLAPGLVVRKEEGENHVLTMTTKLRSLPVYFPKARLGRGGYVRDSPRAYEIYDRNKNTYKAYRIVLAQGDNGQYYGVQGTTWRAPPILDNPTDEVVMRKRTYKRFFDGHKIRLISWETPRAVYWVSNTLSRKLTNKQMMGIARSLQRIGE
ncbi:MAG: polyisoprenyl-teichoic acid--peptidoglycan teichoic acid transferase [Solirubrobacteraceae bacterium]|jgi:LCP family protein required for cell wall assembly|nr:polyisoprenyl-teichoic acid--peptidoglycan teichoic acid transferase [Solirubrobacteraceae bacterium]